jgi:hypothetical protein
MARVKILAGKIPFLEYKPVQLIRAFDKGNIILPRPEPIPSIAYANEIWSLAEMCLRYDPSERTDADKAIKFVLDLNVKDERPPVPAEPRKRPRITVEIDYVNIVSIIERVRTSP